MQFEIGKIRSIEIKDGRLRVESSAGPFVIEIDIKEIKDIGFNTKHPEEEEQ